MGEVNEMNVNGTVFIIEDTAARQDIATTQADLIKTTGVANTARSTYEQNVFAWRYIEPFEEEEDDE